jgi:adenylosuccinate synthase
VTKLDVLDTFPTIKVATAYVDPVTGEELASFPADLELLGSVKVKYEELKRWEKPITGAKSFGELPKEVRAYVELMETFVARCNIYRHGPWPGEDDHSMSRI